MKSYREELWFEAETRRAYINITDRVAAAVRSSGVREAGCSMARVSRTRLEAPSILLRKRKRGIFRSSSSRRIN